MFFLFLFFQWIIITIIETSSTLGVCLLASLFVCILCLVSTPIFFFWYLGRGEKIQGNERRWEWFEWTWLPDKLRIKKNGDQSINDYFCCWWNCWETQFKCRTWMEGKAREQESWFHSLAGYDTSLTPMRSPVRARVEPKSVLFFFIFGFWFSLFLVCLFLRLTHLLFGTTQLWSQ